MKLRTIIINAYLFLIVMNGTAQSISQQILTKEWDAKWISVPGETPTGYGVYLFRKTIDLKTVPSAFIVHVSADNRYKLYINEKLVSTGPARGDMYYWNFETIDIASYLTSGLNIIAAKVWNEGNLRPEAQISWQTGFILQGNTGEEAAVNTNNSWKCIRDTSYRPLTTNEIIGYYVAGPGELVDMRKNMKGWKRLAFNDSTWKQAQNAYWMGGSPKGLQDAFGWMLVPSSIPQMELSLRRLSSVRASEGVSVPPAFPAQSVPVTVPANTKATILLDNGQLTNAYLTLKFSNGREAGIRIKYAEALFIPAKSVKYGTTSGGYMGNENIHGKGNRNEVEEKLFLGRKDSLISDGTLHQEYTTLYWRTYRYIQLNIETKDDPLVIDDIYGTFTGYPFQMNASFGSDRTDMQEILDIGWRTARLCAIETYMDCPFYEQLQYIGDSRIQALVSFYNSGDDRLVRNAINLMDHSRIAEGPTLSRHPSFSPQLIPPFSLWYIGVLHDYWMYRPDSLFIKNKIGGTRQILEFFNRYQQEDGSLLNVPYWNFTDWVPEWPSGVGPKGNTGNSSIHDLQLLWAYQLAAELESNLGLSALAVIYTKRADQLKATIRQKYWSESRGLFADTPEKDFFSQHANSLAILTGMLDDKESETLAQKMISDKSLAQASIYFKYYMHRAFIKARLGNNYLDWLDIWRKNIAMGLTTWAEDSQINTARSDCHAWGSSPNIEFYRTILGIDTDAPGFTKVKIEPHLGDLKKANGEIPHPLGKIWVKYALDKGKWNVQITLPDQLTGSFVWNGKVHDLNGGLNTFVL